MQEIRLLLKDYTIEEILEICEVDPIEALELLIVYGALDLENMRDIEGTDKAE